jgi:hypothetical protein
LRWTVIVPSIQPRILDDALRSDCGLAGTRLGCEQRSHHADSARGWLAEVQRRNANVP